MAEWWKLKREIKRVPRSMLDKIEASFGPLRRIYYDLYTRKSVRHFAGERSVKKEIAVFLIYQPEQLLASTFVTLQHFIDNDIAVVLVANHSLNDEQLEALRPYCHIIIVRPNVGYDFGGYREGVLFVLTKLPQTDRLFLLNDSNWFPVFDDCDVIEKSRKAMEDLYGFFLYTPRPPKPPHIQSFYYRVNKRLIFSSQFIEFWKKMPLIDEKRVVIRRYEFGLSNHILRNGFSLGSYYSNISVAKAVSRLSPEDLKVVLNSYVESRAFRKNKKLQTLAQANMEVLSDQPSVEKMLLEAPEIFFFRFDHPLVTLKSMRSPFLKKFKDVNMARQRAEIFKYGLQKGMNPIILGELESWDN